METTNHNGCLIIFGIGVLILIIIGAAGGGNTFGDYKATEKQACIDSNGDGQWRGSLGVSLDSFCETVASAKMHAAYCSEHPESC
jgi:hypothetical protein